MRRLWLWENGDYAVLDMPPLGRGQWVENCIYCGMVPEAKGDLRERSFMISCTNTDCVNNKSYSLAEWNDRKPKMTHTDARTGEVFISLEERVKRLEERLHKIDGITVY